MVSKGRDDFFSHLLDFGRSLQDLVCHRTLLFQALRPVLIRLFVYRIGSTISSDLPVVFRDFRRYVEDGVITDGALLIAPKGES